MVQSIELDLFRRFVTEGLGFVEGVGGSCFAKRSGLGGGCEASRVVARWVAR